MPDDLPVPESNKPEFSNIPSYEMMLKMKGYELKEALYRLQYAKRDSPSTNPAERERERVAITQELNRRGLNYDHAVAKANKDFDDGLEPNPSKRGNPRSL